MKTHNQRELRSRRKRLRNHGTSAEATLWLLLKGRQLDGRKFRRQHSIGKYVVDFYCPSEKLVVEVDGEQHYTDEGQAHDEKRTQYFLSHGISTIRFENCEVFDRQKAVLQDIKNMFRTTSPPDQKTTTNHNPAGGTPPSSEASEEGIALSIDCVV